MRSETEIPHDENSAAHFDTACPPDNQLRILMRRTDSPDATRLTPHAKTGTVLAFDFGEERIGVAVGDTAVGIAHPLTTIIAGDNRRRFDAIAALIKEWQPALLVVGLPAHRDGTEHTMSRLARKFAQRLNGRYALPVELVDERLTSATAAATLAAAGVAAHKRKALLDEAAACEILQSHFDAMSRTAHTGARK